MQAMGRLRRASDGAPVLTDSQHVTLDPKGLKARTGLSFSIEE